MHKEFFPCGKPSITEEDRQAVADVLSVDSITRSDKVKTFEQAIAAYCKTTEAVAFCNGSSALHALFLSFELKSDILLIAPLSLNEPVH